jgi:hypothetical protein
MRLLLVSGLLVLSTLLARSETNAITMIKTVPEGATLNYSVRGQLRQTMALTPGTYRITIEPVKEK